MTIKELAGIVKDLALEMKKRFDSVDGQLKDIKLEVRQIGSAIIDDHEPRIQKLEPKEVH